MHRSLHRAGRPRRRPLSAVVCALGVLGLVAVLPPARAAFSAVTTNAGTAFAADHVLPASGLSAAQSCTSPSVIAFRGAATTIGGDSVTLAIPTATVAGDVLIAQLVYAYPAATLTAPAAWTRVRLDTSGVAVSAVFVKTAVAGEPGATFSLPAGTGASLGGGVLAYSGVDSSAPVEAAASRSSYGTTVTTPAVTTTRTGTMLVRLITKANETYVAPTGTTQRWRLGSGGGTTASDEPFAGPGTTPSRSSSSTTGTNSDGIGQTIALRHTPGTPSVVMTWTASPSSWATGYHGDVYVNGSLSYRLTVTPISSTSASGALTNGYTYTFNLMAYQGNWQSAAVSTTLTPNCP